MKVKVYLLITVIFLVYQVNNRLVAQCVNSVVTNPNNATNNQLPDVAPSVPTAGPYQQDSRYLNDLHWWQDQFYYLNNMQYNPGQPYPDMQNIQSSGVGSHYKYLNKFLGGGDAAKVMSPDNGWELLLVNLGWYPDYFTPNSDNTYSTVPYLVFYNRYTGIARVFVQYGYNSSPPDALSGVKISLKYDVNASIGNQGNLSGILRLGAGHDNPLDIESDIYSLTAIAPDAGSNNFWMSADFQLTYDPCVCWKPTNLKLEFRFYSESDFKLNGRGVEFEESLFDGTGIIDDLDFLAGVDNTSGNGEESGYIIYKYLDTLIYDYEQKLKSYKTKLTAVSKYNNQVERELAALKVFQIVVKLGVPAAVNSTSMGVLAAVAQDLVFGATSSDEDKKKRKDYYKEIEKILGKQLDTYIAKKFKKKTVPTKPDTPTASFSQMTYSGSINSSDFINGPLFHTPGSFHNDKVMPNDTLHLPIDDNDPQTVVHSVTGYPVYNESLGQFALLNSPKFKISKIVKNIQTDMAASLANTQDYSNPPQSWARMLYQLNKSWETEYQLSLENTLEYRLNPALDIKSYDIEASVKIDVEPTLMTPASDYMKHNLFSKKADMINLTTLGLESDADYQVIKGRGHSFNEWQNAIDPSVFNPLDTIDYYLNPALSNSFSTIIASEPISEDFADPVFSYHSDFMPFNAFKPSIYSFNLVNYTNSYNLAIHSTPQQAFYTDFSVAEHGYESGIKIYLKLLVNIEYNTLNSDGENNSTTLLLTYPVDMDNNVTWDYNSSINPNLVNSPSNLSKYEKTLFMGTTHFAGQEVPGCTRVSLTAGGDFYICSALNKVEIEGDLTVANDGTQVIIQAGEEVNVNNESNVSPEIILRIDQFYDYSQPMPEVSEAFIESFCNNANEYKANVPRFGIVEDENSNGPSEDIEIINPKMDFYLYPNPANVDIISLHLNTDNYIEKSIEITIHDLTGRLVQVENRSTGAGIYTIDIANLAPGTYFVTGSTNDTKQTKRLIVQ